MFGQDIPAYDRFISTGGWECNQDKNFITPKDSSKLFGYITRRQLFDPLLKDVNQTQASVIFRTKNTHWGIRATSEQEGEHISKNAIWASYTIQVRLNEGLYGLAGLKIGAKGLRFESESAFMNGSDMAPDASLGFGFSTQSVTFYYSIKHLFNNSLQPLTTVLDLKRHKTLLFQYKRDISDKVKLDVYTHFLIDPEIKNKLWTGAKFHTHNGLGAGVGFSSNAKFFMQGSYDLKIFKGNNLLLFVGYESDISQKAGVRLPTFQTGLVLKKNKTCVY